MGAIHIFAMMLSDTWLSDDCFGNLKSRKMANLLR